MRHHLISIDEEGSAVDPVTRARIKDSGAYFDAILRAADEESARRAGIGERSGDCPCAGHRHPAGKTREVRRLLIHIHGGLNDSDFSLEASERMARAALGEGDLNDWHYPVFVTWPSGSTSSYAEHLFVLRQGRHAYALGPLTSPIYLARDVVAGVVNSPRNWLYQGTTDTALAAKVAFDWTLLSSWRNAERLARAATARPPLYSLRCGGYRRGAAAQGLRLVVYWSTFPFKLLTSAVVLDGMGSGAWQVMLHRTRNVFRPGREFELQARVRSAARLREAVERKASGALAELLRRLVRHINDEARAHEGLDTSPCYQITLVGHSMGAIIINDVLRLFPGLPVTRVVYMAPACSIAEAEQSLVPFLKRNPRSWFHILTLHPQAEADEINALDLVPRGSLLEWIDNWYTTPTSHTERRLGKWTNLLQALHVFESVKRRVTMKAFGVDGDSLPQKHGDFNLCPFWKEEFWRPGGPMIYRQREAVEPERAPAVAGGAEDGGAQDGGAEDPDYALPASSLRK